MSQSQENEDLSLARELFSIATVCREKKASDWESVEHRLLLLTKSLLQRPACQAHCAQFDNSFAFLSADIIAAIVEMDLGGDTLKDLSFLDGTWGDVASRRLKKKEKDDKNPNRRIIIKKWNQDKWKNLVRDANKLFGHLELRNICKWIGSGEIFYPNLRPAFHSIVITYHTDQPYSKELLAPLRAFLVKQLKSRYLSNLELQINGNLGIENELLEFFRSNPYEKVDLKFPLPAAFFVQLYEIARTSKNGTEYDRPVVRGFCYQSEWRELAENLKLTRDSYSIGRRHDRCKFLYRDIDIGVTHSQSSLRIDVTIEVTHAHPYLYKDEDETMLDSDSDENENSEQCSEDSYEEEEDEEAILDLDGDTSRAEIRSFWDGIDEKCEYEDDEDNDPGNICHSGCEKLGELRRYNHEEYDCRDCEGCGMCQKARFCNRCCDRYECYC